MPSIMWEVTVCAHAFLNSAVMAEEFDLAKADQQDPPYTAASLNIDNLASLTITLLSDLPPFLSALQCQPQSTCLQPRPHPLQPNNLPPALTNQNHHRMQGHTLPCQPKN